MGNHWHFVVGLRREQYGEASDFFQRLSVTHSMRFHAHRGTLGMGHVYQGCFKSLPIEQDQHLLADSPAPLGRNWLAKVDKPLSMAELQCIH